MFIGHFGVGFAAKKLDSRPSLGTYFIAAQFVDLLWPLFLLAGIERVVVEPGNTAFTPLNFIYYPFTHSLAGSVFWAILFGLIYFLSKKNLRSSILLGAAVLSHWILDLLTHIPDLPLSPWSNIKFGFGLWNSIALTILIEGLIFIAGIYLYINSTKAANKTGSFSLWGLILFLVIICIMNITGPPPPDEKAIGWVGLSQWLIIAWGYWIDRNRTAKALT